ncbi:MAG: septum formation initiator [Marmoricola sp.]|nr:septum formation initiator [Marmoricola sp.]
MNRTPARHSLPLRRRLTTSAVAMTMVLPLSVVAVGAPASAAIEHFRGRHQSSSASVAQNLGQGPGQSWPPYAGSSGTITADTDPADATTAQSTGVVQISTTLDFGTGEAAGTGMVIDSDGTVITNHHVVADATAITVTVPSTGTTYDATVVGTNAVTDVAVLKLSDASGLTTVTTDTAGTAVGDDVTAVGDAGGDGGSLTAADGTITGLQQSVTVQNESGTGSSTLTGLIEVDADIIPGDSGGALLDSSGTVVGMNVAASSGTQNITGYVIPIRRVLTVADQILAGDTGTGNVIGYSGFLGVQLASDASTPTVAGVVDDSPAAAAGLAAGDTITAIDGTSITTATGLRESIGSYQAGRNVKVSWTDSTGTTHTATVTLAQAPVA